MDVPGAYPRSESQTPDVYPQHTQLQSQSQSQPQYQQTQESWVPLKAHESRHEYVGSAPGLNEQPAQQQAHRYNEPASYAMSAMQAGEIQSHKDDTFQSGKKLDQRRDLGELEQRDQTRLNRSGEQYQRQLHEDTRGESTQQKGAPYSGALPTSTQGGIYNRATGHGSPLDDHDQHHGLPERGQRLEDNEVSPVAHGSSATGARVAGAGVVGTGIYNTVIGRGSQDETAKRNTASSSGTGYPGAADPANAAGTQRLAMRDRPTEDLASYGNQGRRADPSTSGHKGAAGAGVAAGTIAGSQALREHHASHSASRQPDTYRGQQSGFTPANTTSSRELPAARSTQSETGTQRSFPLTSSQGDYQSQPETGKSHSRAKEGLAAGAATGAGVGAYEYAQRHKAAGQQPAQQSDQHWAREPTAAQESTSHHHRAQTGSSPDAKARHSRSSSRGEKRHHGLLSHAKVTEDESGHRKLAKEPPADIAPAVIAARDASGRQKRQSPEGETANSQGFANTPVAVSQGQNDGREYRSANREYENPQGAAIGGLSHSHDGHHERGVRPDASREAGVSSNQTLEGANKRSSEQNDPHYGRAIGTGAGLAAGGIAASELSHRREDRREEGRTSQANPGLAAGASEPSRRHEGRTSQTGPGLAAGGIGASEPSHRREDRREEGRTSQAGHGLAAGASEPSRRHDEGRTSQANSGLAAGASEPSRRHEGGRAIGTGAGLAAGGIAASELSHRREEGRTSQAGHGAAAGASEPSRRHEEGRTSETGPDLAAGNKAAPSSNRSSLPEHFSNTHNTATGDELPYNTLASGTPSGIAVGSHGHSHGTEAPGARSNTASRSAQEPGHSSHTRGTNIVDHPHGTEAPGARSNTASRSAQEPGHSSHTRGTNIVDHPHGTEAPGARSNTASRSAQDTNIVDHRHAEPTSKSQQHGQEAQSESHIGRDLAAGAGVGAAAYAGSRAIREHETSGRQYPGTLGDPAYTQPANSAGLAGSRETNNPVTSEYANRNETTSYPSSGRDGHNHLASGVALGAATSGAYAAHQSDPYSSQDSSSDARGLQTSRNTTNQYTTPGLAGQDASRYIGTANTRGTTTDTDRNLSDRTGAYDHLSSGTASGVARERSIGQGPTQGTGIDAAPISQERGLGSQTNANPSGRSDNYQHLASGTASGVAVGAAAGAGAAGLRHNKDESLHGATRNQQASHSATNASGEADDSPYNVLQSGTPSGVNLEHRRRSKELERDL